MKRAHLSVSPLVLISLVGCSIDQGSSKHYADLSAEISSPEDAAVVAEGETVTFLGEVADKNSLYEATELKVVWTGARDASSDREELCAETYANQASDTGDPYHGASLCTAAVSLPFVCLTVLPPEGTDAGDEDCITLEITPSNAPEVEIVEPLADGVYYADRLIPLTATASDVEDAPEALQVDWTSSLDGEVASDIVPPSSGTASAFVYLSQGEHALTATATDTDGHTGTATRIVEVGPPNTAPTCTISAPDDGGASSVGSVIDFRASVADVDIAEDALTVTWTSDLDGTLRTSTPDSAGNVAFSTSDLSAGTHVISLIAEDEVGATCTDYILYTVGAPPTVEVTSPIDGAELTVGEAERFEALVADTEDRPEVLELQWESDVDGVLSVAPADSTGAALLTSSTLSIGTHTITLTATDTDGLYTWDVVTVDVVDCPDLWYEDTDGDGYGDPARVRTGCTAPAGYVGDASDCDDGDAEVHPGAAEVCDGVDNNCDGAIDDTTAVDTTEWYADADGDRFGDAATTTWACTAPAGFVGDDTDCDDGSAGVYPGATELVADGVDEDCDGTEVCWQDADTDTFGASVTRASIDLDCVDAGEAAVDGDCDDTVAAVHPGAIESVADGIDQDCDGGDACLIDADGDGYGDVASTPSADLDCLDAGEASVDTDCNDRVAAINPGATEVCDGTDNDCDGTVDEPDAADAVILYDDADGDGFGDDGSPTVGCDAGFGLVEDNTDCDDAEAGIHPGATEIVADGTDEDCDGTELCRADVDDDGYGGATTQVSLDLDCDDVGEATTATDCADTVAAVNPGATEACDGLDNNCDGRTDEAGASGETVWYADADGDGFGDPAGGTSACTAPAGSVADATDCDDTTASVSPAASEGVADAVDSDCDGREVCYRDGDLDSYGTTLTVSSADIDCIDSGESTNSTDCDDAAASVHPGAAEVTADGVDQDCSGADDCYVDVDHDGYGSTSTTPSTDGDCTDAGEATNASDCDDHASGVNPAAVETCNGIDDDCDGAADEAGATGASTWYSDADGDTYGSTSTTTACSAPSGYVGTSGDCDDSRSAVNPAATETCATSYDDDCDGLTNEVGASACTTWYVDADGDAYGGGSTVCQCEASGSYTASVGSDCNDASASVHPGASEVCDSSNTDEDCDGSADDADSSVSGKTTWYRDADADGYGSSTSTTSKCDLPSGYTDNNDDCDDSDGDVNPGAEEVCRDGIDQDCDGADCGWSGDYNIDDSSVYSTRFYGEASSDYLGTAVAGGDIDGDGDADLLTIANGNDDGGSGYGSLYYVEGGFPTGSRRIDSVDDGELYGSSSFALHDVMVVENSAGDDFYMRNSGSSTGYLYTSPPGSGVSWTSSYAQAVYCSAAAGAGDFNSTAGTDEWICGNSGASSYAGAAYIYTIGSSTAVATFTGEAANDLAGSAVAGCPGCDADGDGYDDVWIGAWANPSSTEKGAVYLVLGPASGTIALSSADNKTTGSSSSDNLGMVLDCPGDVDGDGKADVFAAAPYDDDGGTNAGTVYLFADATTDSSASAADARFYGESGSDYLGIDGVSGGDVDGDGNVDVLMCDYGTGAAWLVYGPLSGTYDFGAGAYDARFTDDAMASTTGHRCAVLGDTDGDGRDDMAIAGSRYDYSSGSRNGAVWILLGE